MYCITSYLHRLVAGIIFLLDSLVLIILLVNSLVLRWGLKKTKFGRNKIMTGTHLMKLKIVVNLGLGHLA
jgi:hypothetical protein